MIDNADDEAADAMLAAMDISPDDEDNIIAEFSVTGDDDRSQYQSGP
ncbi:hypothetical protein [Xenorhabdus szentirmaii]|uniref:Uncharacterized protein n=1 Tax=Xenorhabdus szentirmaii DSM 16338 TaxID=1427518 RepID=W1ITE4_9GAMM|nr:hypothetical protein [Xenorhabdus szentirmaii]CDL81098.1 hypothetical protein XSR1_1000004 [Xenorhabdus szentirmaii DSM 16338]